jgi:hypothetical protein
MPDRNEQTQATEAVKALSVFLNEPDVESLSANEVRTQLSAIGVNIENAKKRFNSLLVEAKARALLSNAGAQRRAFTEKMAEFRNRFVESGDLRGQIGELLQEIFGEQQDAAVAWRNFDEATDSDLRSMLDDMTLLEELQKDDSPHTDG